MSSTIKASFSSNIKLSINWYSNTWHIFMHANTKLCYWFFLSNFSVPAIKLINQITCVACRVKYVFDCCKLLSKTSRNRFILAWQSRPQCENIIDFCKPRSKNRRICFLFLLWPKFLIQIKEIHSKLMCLYLLNYSLKM